MRRDETVKFGLKVVTLLTGLVGVGAFLLNGFLGDIMFSAVLPTMEPRNMLAFMIPGFVAAILLLVQCVFLFTQPRRRVALTNATLLTVSWFVCVTFNPVMWACAMWAGGSTLGFLAGMVFTGRSGTFRS